MKDKIWGCRILHVLIGIHVNHLITGLLIFAVTMLTLGLNDNSLFSLALCSSVKVFRSLAASQTIHRSGGSPSNLSISLSLSIQNDPDREAKQSK